MNIKIFKIFSIASIILLSQNVYSLDFYGQNLEKSTKEQLDKFLKSNTGTLKYKNIFSHTYVHNTNDEKNKIFAKWSKIFFNSHGEFVGLQLGIHDNNDKAQQITIRQSLVDKYGHPSNTVANTFHTSSFHGNASWDFDNNMKISYSNDVFRTLARRNTLEGEVNTVISYFHTTKKEILIQDIKYYLYKNEEKTIKKAF